MPPANRARQPPPRISEAEWDVMRVLWERGEVTAQEVCAAVPASRDWSDRTVKTLLARLVKKGALAAEPEGRCYRYRPAVSREACEQHASQSFVERVFGGDPSPLVASLVRGGRLTPEQLAELRGLLDEETA